MQETKPPLVGAGKIPLILCLLAFFCATLSKKLSQPARFVQMSEMSQVLITLAEWRHSHVCERCWCLQHSAWLHLLIKVCVCVTKTDRGMWKGKKEHKCVCVCLTFGSVTPTGLSSSCLWSDADTQTANLLSLLSRANVCVTASACVRKKKGGGGFLAQLEWLQTRGCE